MNRIEGVRWLRAMLAALSVVVCIDAPVQAQDSAPQAVQVPVGSHKLLRLPSAVGRVAIGDPKVADINVVNARELLLLGKSPGTTSLLVWPRAGSKRHPAVVAEYSVSVGGFAGQTLGPDMAKIVVQPGAGLSGTAPDLFSHDSAVKAAASADKGVTINDRSVVALDSQVMSQVKVVEVTRTTAQSYGLNIFGYTGSGNALSAGSFGPGSLTSVGLNSSNSNTLSTGGISTISSAGYVPLTNAFNFVLGNRYFAGILSVLENKGLARTLAEPSLTAMSGQTATFLAGGEFPIPVPQSSGGGGSTATVTIQYKEYGIRLNLTPTVLSATRIALKISPEVSELDYTNGVNLNGYVVPGLIVRRTDTMVELGDGESYVISGLVSNNMKANVDKVPLLGDLPIIGAFFKSNTFERDEKELIMIVTPHVVRPFAKGAQLPPLPGAKIDSYQPSFADTMFFERGDFGQSDHGYSR